MGDRMGSSPIDRTNRKDDENRLFFIFCQKCCGVAALLVLMSAALGQLKCKRIISGSPRDTVYPWGKGAHKQKSERYRPR